MEWIGSVPKDSDSMKLKILLKVIDIQLGTEIFVSLVQS